MPWEVKDVVEQRIEFVERALSREESISTLCRLYGISRTSGHKWLSRYLTERRIDALKDRSRRPLTSPNRTEARIETRVVKLQGQYGWGPKKIHKLLSNEGINIPLITVRRIYQRNGLSDTSNIIGPALKRFERSHPNELVQMDYKGQFMTDDRRWCYPLTMLDDHSRYCIGLHTLTEQSGKSAEKCLIKTFENYGVPEGMLMDHGTPWWSSSNGWGLTQLAVKLIKQGIDLCFSGIRHPQTQGKVERFHRTLKQELRRQHGKLASIRACEQILDEFRHTYNTIRPHESLDQNTPASRYTPSRKQYCAEPDPWEYPEGSTVLTLDYLGRLNYDGRKFFVCEALGAEEVRIIPLEMTALVVYRNMALRELDLDTGLSNPTAFPVGKNFAPWG